MGAGVGGVAPKQTQSVFVVVLVDLDEPVGTHARGLAVHGLARADLSSLSILTAKPVEHPRREAGPCTTGNLVEIGECQPGPDHLDRRLRLNGLVGISGAIAPRVVTIVLLMFSHAAQSSSNLWFSLGGFNVSLDKTITWLTPIQYPEAPLAETSTRTVERALDLMGIVCDQGAMTLAEAAREADLPVSTTLRLLRTVEASKWLTRDDAGIYRPGTRLIQVGAQAFSNDSLADLSRQPMQDLAAETGESVYLSVEAHGDTVLYISIVEGNHSVRHVSWVGHTIPATGSAAGRVLQGHTPDEGYLVSENIVEEDVTAISAPVHGGNGPIAAMSILVPTYRATQQKNRSDGALLRHAASEVSRKLRTTSH